MNSSVVSKNKYASIGLIASPETKKFNDYDEKIEKFKLIAAGEAVTAITRKSLSEELDLFEFTDFLREWTDLNKEVESNELSRAIIQKQYNEYIVLMVKLKNEFLDVISPEMKFRMMSKLSFGVVEELNGLSLIQLFTQVRVVINEYNSQEPGLSAYNALKRSLAVGSKSQTLESVLSSTREMSKLYGKATRILSNSSQDVVVQPQQVKVVKEKYYKIDTDLV